MCQTTFSNFLFCLILVFFKVYTKGMLLFREVANALKKIRSQFAGRTVNLQGVSLDLSGIEEILKLERSEFEVGFP